MDFNFRIPHANGEIALSVTGAQPQAAFAAIQMGHEIAALLGGQVEPDAAPVAIQPDPQPEALAQKQAEEPTTEEPQDEAKVDSAGVPFDPELHTGTLKKDGTWRLKRGAAQAASDEADEGNEEPSNATPPPAQETTDAGVNAGTDDLPEITDAELQRYCGRLAAHFGGSEKVFALAAQFVDEGDMPRPSNIKDQAKRHAFIKQAQDETGVAYHG
jgi:hypothetical protein